MDNVTIMNRRGFFGAVAAVAAAPLARRKSAAAPDQAPARGSVYGVSGPIGTVVAFEGDKAWIRVGDLVAIDQFGRAVRAGGHRVS